MSEGQPLVTPEEAARATSPQGRFAIVNVWRNIRAAPVQRFPLAVVAAASVREEDLVTFEIHYADRIGENYFVKANPAHKWYYFPAMEKKELLLMKQWDSHGRFGANEGGCGGTAPHSEIPAPPPTPPTFCVHSAFDDPSSCPGTEDRESIEVRCAVLF